MIMTIFRLDGGDSHYAMDSDGSSPDETVESLITGFRATLSKLGKKRESFFNEAYFNFLEFN